VNAFIVPLKHTQRTRDKVMRHIKRHDTEPKDTQSHDTQRTVTHRESFGLGLRIRVAVFCRVMECVAVCCRVLQCVAEYCSVLQCFAACCDEIWPDSIVLQEVALRCSDTQYASD